MARCTYSPRVLVLFAALCLIGRAFADDDIHLITLEPGHFHATLFQKEMLPGVSPVVHVYAPPGPDLSAYLNRVGLFNTRETNPTNWQLEIHASSGSMNRLLQEHPGNVVVYAGNNLGKMDKVLALVNGGLNVLADKPWILDSTDFPKLAQALAMAKQKKVIAYDAMTQRYEISCVVQRELVNTPEIFGECEMGSPDNPAIYMKSAHYICKVVSGVPLQRPPWFFDHAQQGEPLPDIGTHVVDLVQWMLCPSQTIDYATDINVLDGTRSPISISLAQFQAVTGLGTFPKYLEKAVQGDSLTFYGNNSVAYTLKGHHVKLETIWEYDGGTDYEFAVCRGTRSRIEVRQGKTENFIPEVFVAPNRTDDIDAIEAALKNKIAALQSTCPGLAVVREQGALHVTIPQALRVGHEAHFGLLINTFLGYVRRPETLPAWEDSYMLAKYHVTTEGIRLAREKK